MSQKGSLAHIKEFLSTLT